MSHQRQISVYALSLAFWGWITLSTPAEIPYSALSFLLPAGFHLCSSWAISHWPQHSQEPPSEDSGWHQPAGMKLAMRHHTWVDEWGELSRLKCAHDVGQEWSKMSPLVSSVLQLTFGHFLSLPQDHESILWFVDWLIYSFICGLMSCWSGEMLLLSRDVMNMFPIFSNFVILLHSFFYAKWWNWYNKLTLIHCVTSFPYPCFR